MLFGQFLLTLKDTPVKEADLDMAIEIQEELDAHGKKHKAIGEILVDMGVITDEYLETSLALQEALKKVDFAHYLSKMNQSKPQA